MMHEHSVYNLCVRLELKNRGRWSSDKSVARYESKARLAESLDTLPAHSRRHPQQCGPRVGELLLGRVEARSLPPL